MNHWTMAGSKDQIRSNKKSLLFIKPSIQKTSYKRMERLVANLLALYALVEAGDHVVSMLPTYQQLYDIPKSLGATVDFVHLKEEEDWQFDLEQLEALVKPETKIICLNSANNPTGTLLDRKILEKIAEIARTVDAYVLIDEVYAPLTDKGEFLSIVDVYEKGIATNSLSKTYSIPGIRIGWTATGPELAEVFRKYRDYTMICGGVLSDDLAVHALKNKEKILERNKKNHYREPCDFKTVGSK